MHALRVKVRSGTCCGFGNCAAICPAVFVIDKQRNRLTHVDNTRVADHVDDVLRAVNECPSGALTLVSGSADRQA